MKKFIGFTILLLLITSMSINVYAASDKNQKTYVLLYDEAHGQFFTHELMKTALSSLNSSFDKNDLDITFKMIVNNATFNNSNLQGADLLIISNPGKNASTSAESHTLPDFIDNGGSILRLANPFSLNQNISVHAKPLDDLFLDIEDFDTTLNTPDIDDTENTTILLNDYNNDGDPSHIFLPGNQVKPAVLVTEINDIQNSNILYYGTTFSTNLPKIQLQIVGNTSKSTYTVNKEYEILFNEVGNTQYWMLGNEFDDEKGRIINIGSTIMFSDYEYDESSNWIDQESNLEFFQNIVAWLVKITPLDKPLQIVDEDFSFFVRINLLTGLILSLSLFLAIYGTFVYRGKLSLIKIFNLRVGKAKVSTKKEHLTNEQKEGTVKKKSKKRRKRA